MKANVVHQGDAEFRDLGGGVERRVLAYTPQMMIAEVRFKAGGEGSAHTHPHAQNTYVRSGRFRFTVEDETVEVGPGDSLAFPPGVLHGTVCLEAGTLIDVFAPMREDFL